MLGISVYLTITHFDRPFHTSSHAFLHALRLLDRLFLKTLEGQRLRVWSDVSEAPLGEQESYTGGDALNYIAKDTVTTSVRESITINGGHVIRANIIADNGILHVIDKVLIPQFTML